MAIRNICISMAIIMAIILISINLITASIVPQILPSSSSSSAQQQQQSPTTLIDHVIRPRDFDEFMSKYGNYLQRSRLVTPTTTTTTTTTTTASTSIPLNPSLSIIQNRMLQSTSTSQLNQQQQQDLQQNLYNGYSQHQQQQRFNRDNIGRSGMAVVNTNNAGFVQDSPISIGSSSSSSSAGIGKVELSSSSIHHDQDDILNTSTNNNQNGHYGIKDDLSSLQMNDQQQQQQQQQSIQSISSLLPPPPQPPQQSSTSSSSSPEPIASALNRRPESIKNPGVSPSSSTTVVMVGQLPSSSSSLSSSSSAQSTSTSSSLVSTPSTSESSSSTVNNHLNSATISDMFISIDGRLQKLQDQMIYYRSMNNFGLNSPTAFPSYFNMMKTQFLSMENLVESKLSTIENKFSNIVIEDEIWKKTINWKVEEILSKISQSENKVTFSNEQMLNKLDLIERNFKVITNDLFSKFLLVNEKLNMIELNIQNKLNDFGTKIRKTFDYQQKLIDLFKQDFNTNNNNNHGTTESNGTPQQRFSNRNSHGGDNGENYSLKNLPIHTDMNDSGMGQESFENGYNWTNQQQQQQHQQSEFDMIMDSSTNEQQHNNRKPTITRDELIAQCEPLFQRWKQNKFNQDDAHQLIICKQLLTSLENGDFIQQQQQQQQQYTNRDRIEKRDSADQESMMINDPQQQHISLKSKDIVDNNKMDDIINSSNGGGVNDYGGQQTNGNKKLSLEELDSKLQYFATKIIKIVQEMWHASQTSQQYLLETLLVTNETKEMIREEFNRLNGYVKPLNLLASMTDDIRDPIMTRLKEMTTAINNSVAVILNTQSQYMMRQDEQAYKILTISVSELRNHSTMVSRKVQEQSIQMNQKFEQIYKSLNQIGRKTIETVGHQLLDIMKKELHTIKSILSERSKISVNELDLDSPKSLTQNQCKNDCFISRQEIDNLCYNIESKPSHFRSETPSTLIQSSMATRDTPSLVQNNVSGFDDHYDHIDHPHPLAHHHQIGHGKNLTNIVEINNGGSSSSSSSSSNSGSNINNDNDNDDDDDIPNIPNNNNNNNNNNHNNTTWNLI
ncbi:hypothetical protein DERF_010112 [Dermatophagoides farinae]|uniref:Uncharacterized protein n=1 Tax=Dermatophagoides farinae TaxID=6954 RepID=A0A922HWB6_DERFA|nr:hypothetical protein DERF_010112 [Dermatophagoides farinae]